MTGVQTCALPICFPVTIVYLGIKGFGHSEVNQYLRSFPAIFNLAYWDIFKNYYANKQEEKAYVVTGVDHTWKSISIGSGIAWDRTYTKNKSTTYRIEVTAENPKYIQIEFEENVSPEQVNEIQFLTNDPHSALKVNKLTKLGDSFVFERTDPDAPGLREPKNPKKATNIYMYKIQRTIQIAYNMGIAGENQITMPDNQKIKLTEFPLKNIKLIS